jgi:hypothetical protein
VVALNNLMLGKARTLERSVEVNRACGTVSQVKETYASAGYVGHTACFTTTKSPSSSNGMPMSVKNASAGLRITMALKS